MVNDCQTIGAVFDVSLLEERFERTQIGDMSCHIRREYHADAPFAESLKFIACELRQKIELLLVHNRKRLSHMEILLHALVIVADGPVADCVDVVGIVEAIVCVVVANAPYTD